MTPRRPGGHAAVSPRFNGIAHLRPAERQSRSPHDIPSSIMAEEAETASMAQESPNHLQEWWQAACSQGRDLRQRFVDWLDVVRAEPALIWQTPTVRYVVYGFVGLFVVMVATWLFTPAPPEGAKPEARTADFHVVCGNVRCEHHFVIRREFGFRKFPVPCPQCDQKTGMEARLCNSKTCRARWVVPERIDGGWRCPACGGRFE